MLDRRLAYGTLVFVALTAIDLAPLHSAEATLFPARDNTLYESPDGSLSNALGEGAFVGTQLGGSRKRMLIQFDLTSIPAGSTISCATLRVTVNRTQAPASLVELHRLTASWGQGSSSAGPSRDGGGAPATTNDPTWLHRFYPSTFWASAGGDFAATISSSVVMGGAGDYTFPCTPQFTSDVQSFVNGPSSNNGWILITDEVSAPTAKRIATVDSIFSNERPRLVVTYTPPAAGSGRVPDRDGANGAALRLTRVGSLVRLTWSASCDAGDTDYSVYEGTIGSFGATSPALCSTGGALTADIPALGAARFFLVVPHRVTAEGSYGKRSDGTQRPPSPTPCRTQNIGACGS